MSKNKRILVMAGGTGGHIFPALAIAKNLKDNSANIEWLGTVNGLEHKLVPNNGFTLHSVMAVGIRGKNIISLIKAPFFLTIALFQTIKVFIKFKPEVVLGMGGFVSGIGGLVAYIFRKPLIIHEQNALPGTTNLLLSKIATQTFQAFDNTFTNNPNVITSGNPISFNKIDKTEKNSPLNLLVLGGSLGAKSINDCIPHLKTELNIWHQTGEQHLKDVKFAYKNNTRRKTELTIEPFIEDIAKAYAWSDIVICRSGAMTISELIATNSVAILIPFPYAIDDHQTENAKILSDENAGILLPQKQLDPIKLDRIINNIPIEEISSNIKKLKFNDSAALISDYIRNKT
jgi:UDP-N-acetylglucosamine--N-acetylmuramyl-(pentapeptide) pyrophosphoryl-undecaprenol N-acetylglucosamine transferase